MKLKLKNKVELENKDDLNSHALSAPVEAYPTGKVGGSLHSYHLYISLLDCWTLLPS